MFLLENTSIRLKVTQNILVRTCKEITDIILKNSLSIELTATIVTGAKENPGEEKVGYDNGD
jgi:hypothetical protein